MDDKYIGSVLYYLSQPDSMVSNGAVTGLATILRNKRAIVMNGGSLSRTDQKWISDSRLIKLFTEATIKAI